MSYQHPTYLAHLDRFQTDKDYYFISTWSSRMLSNRSEVTREYSALMYPDGWFSVDGDEWWGEFPSKAEAEEYLGIVFTLEEEHDD